MKRATLRRSAWIVAACAMLAACGANGGDPHAGEQSLTAPDHAYRVWYLAPPWTLDATATMGDHAVLKIAALDSGNSPTPLRGASSVLTIDVVPASTDVVIAAARTAMATDSGALLYDARPVAFAGNVMGLEIAYEPFGSTVRVATARLPDGRSLVLQFQSVDTIQDDPDVTAMIGQTETTGIAP
jgi:hypothetical protein